jgi:hypothetical protein
MSAEANCAYTERAQTMPAGEPTFVPPVHYALLRLVAERKLKPLDVIVWMDQAARINWTWRESYIRETYGIGSDATYKAMIKRLKLAELLASGGKESGNKTLPPVATKSGFYEKGSTPPSSWSATKARDSKPGTESVPLTNQQNEDSYSKPGTESVRGSDLSHEKSPGVTSDARKAPAPDLSPRASDARSAEREGRSCQECGTGYPRVSAELLSGWLNWHKDKGECARTKERLGAR